MARLTTILIVKLMTFWNYVCSLYSSTINKYRTISHYIKDYYHGYNDTWLFIPGHTYPLSLNNIYNIIEVDWLYNNFERNLFLYTNKTDDHINCKVSWLSAKINITDPYNPDEIIEYCIDDFIENFTVQTRKDIPPSLYTIFMCWCAHTKHWFKLEDIIEFIVIDEMGDEIILNLRDHDNSLVIKRNKICIVIHSEDITESIILDPSDAELSDDDAPKDESLEDIKPLEEEEESKKDE
jgi:hypothetical protein